MSDDELDNIRKTSIEQNIFSRKPKIGSSPIPIPTTPKYTPLFDKDNNKIKSDTLKTQENPDNPLKIIDDNITLRKKQKIIPENPPDEDNIKNIPKTDDTSEKNNTQKTEGATNETKKTEKPSNSDNKSKSDNIPKKDDIKKTGGASNNSTKTEKPSNSGQEQKEKEEINKKNKKDRTNDNKDNNEKDTNSQNNEANASDNSFHSDTNDFPAYHLSIEYSLKLNSKETDRKIENIPLINREIDLTTAHRIFLKALSNHFDKLERESNEIDSLSSWSFGEMANIPIKDITDLIKEYKGEEKELNAFIKNIDRLWKHIEAYEAVDKNRFMLVLQLKLTEKAADATKEVEFDTWDTVKTALKDNINPQKNIEKAELKLATIKQLAKEDVEVYAKRVEDLLDNLNKSFSSDAGNEIIKKENDRKARKAFENGLFDRDLRNKAISRGNKTFRETVDYVTEQELRQTEFQSNTSEDMFCSHCKTKTHNTQDCRSRRYFNRSPQDNRPNREITCYKCNRKGHYASECKTKSNPNSPNESNSQNRPQNERNNNNQRPNSPGNTSFNNSGNTNYNSNKNSNSPRHEQKSPRENKNIRLYDSEVLIEEAIVYAEQAELDRKN